MLLLYQMIHNYYDLNCTSFFSHSTISITRGHNMKLQKPHTNCLPRSSLFFSVRVINDWNSLPQTVINASSANQFKNLLDRHYLDVMYDFKCKPLCT